MQKFENSNGNTSILVEIIRRFCFEPNKKHTAATKDLLLFNT